MNKKAVLLIVISIFSLSAFANDDEVIIEEPSVNKVQMHYFRGFLVDAANNGQAGVDLIDSVKIAAEANGIDFKGSTSHWTSHQSVCEDLAKTPNTKIILVGHSYGASGAMLVSNCLAAKGILTEILISISSFDGGTGVEVSKVPEHVLINYNFWVTDLAIPGYIEHVALNPEKTQVKNTKIKMYGPPVVGPHLFVPNKLILLNTKLILKHILGNKQISSFPDSLSSSEPDKLSQDHSL